MMPKHFEDGDAHCSPMSTGESHMDVVGDGDGDQAFNEVTPLAPASETNENVVMYDADEGDRIYEDMRAPPAPCKGCGCNPETGEGGKESLASFCK